MALSVLDSLLDKARSLYEADLYSSALFLLGLKYSRLIDAKETNTWDALETYILYARACMRLRLFRRALKIWDLAYKNISTHKGDDVNKTRYEVLQEYGECAFLSGLFNIALKVISMLAIGDTQCIQVGESMDLSRKYLREQLLNGFTADSLARKSYISAIEVNNFAVEAIDGALRTGVDLDVILGMIKNSSPDIQYVAEYCRAEYALTKGNYEVSFDVLSRLSMKFSSSIELSQSLFTCNYLSGNYAEAYKDYGRMLMRDLDPIVCAPMQATLLKERGKVEELDSLRKNIYSVGKGTPECYLVSANLADASGDIPKALRCVEKALKIRNRFVDAWIMKGYLLSRDKKHVNALEAFWIAESLRGSVESYEGIVKCLLRLKRINEATAVSTMVASKHTKNSRVIVLCVEVVLARKGPDYLKEAKYLLKKALSINKHCLAAIKKYTQVLMMKKEYDREKSIDSNLSTMDLPILHSLKGDVYVCKYDLCRAETEYSTALHLDPRCPQAKKGLSQIQTLFKNEESKLSFKNELSTREKGQDSDEALL